MGNRRAICAADRVGLNTARPGAAASEEASPHLRLGCVQTPAHSLSMKSRPDEVHRLDAASSRGADKSALGEVSKAPARRNPAERTRWATPAREPLRKQCLQAVAMHHSTAIASALQPEALPEVRHNATRVAEDNDQPENPHASAASSILS